jgi:hypothetical protein
MATVFAYRTDTDDEVRVAPVLGGSSIASEGPGSESSAPGWLAPTDRAVRRLLDLPRNWNQLGAPRIDVDAIGRALELLSWAAATDTPPPDVIPTVSGGVQLEWHRNRLDIELEVAPQREATLFWSDRDTGREWEGMLAARRPAELVAALAELTVRNRTRPHGAR